jgi:tRNA1(Val) A37 N6-methylase TrmN6
VIVFARKGGNGPTELMPGLVLYNQQGKMTKKAKLISEDGVFKFYKQFI